MQSVAVAALRAPRTDGDKGRVRMFIPEEDKIVTKAQGCIGHELAKGGHIVDEKGQKISATNMRIRRFRGAEVITLLVINPGPQYDFCIDLAAPAHAAIVYKA